MTTYRSVEAGEDERFLAELAALSGQEPGSPCIRAWGEPWDYGLIAEEDDEAVGAVWSRQYLPADGIAPEAVREVFIGVRPDRQRLGIGTTLWTRILEVARSDEGVGFLVAVVTPGSAGCTVPGLEAARFRKLSHSTWQLGPLR